jgi:hypothetical protein
MSAKSWESDLFLVVALGDHHFAFYSVMFDQFLGAFPSRTVYGLWPAVALCPQGISDETFLSQIPSCAVFVVLEESSDGSVLSIFSKRTKQFVEMAATGYIECKAARVSTLATFQIASVMDAEKLMSRLNVSPAHESAAATTIHQSFTRFVTWKDGLKDSADWRKGNVMAAVEATSAGDIVDVRTEVVSHAVTESKTVQLGKLAMMRDLSHGNVVAFHSPKHKGFLDMTWNQIKWIECEAGKLSLTEHRTYFLVIELGNDRFSFYSISHEKFVVAKSNNALIGVQPSKCLRDSRVADQFIYDCIPDGGVFVVKQERSDGSSMSLYSENLQTYVTVRDGGTVDVTAMSPGESQCFQLVLLFKVDKLGT